MSLTTECPVAAVIPNVPETTCPIRIDQIAKIIFQRRQTTPSFTATTILLKATLTPLLSAVDATKCVLSPPLTNPVIPNPELDVVGGGDNSTIGGIRNVRGQKSVTMTATLNNISSATKIAMQNLMDYSKYPMAGATDLWAYFLTTDGRIFGIKNGSNIEGIPVYNVATGSLGSEGYGADNVHNFSLDLARDWDDNLEIYKLTDYTWASVTNP